MVKVITFKIRIHSLKIASCLAVKTAYSEISGNCIDENVQM